jgi:hypothetical protein
MIDDVREGLHATWTLDIKLLVERGDLGVENPQACWVVNKRRIAHILCIGDEATLGMVDKLISAIY